MKLFCGQIQKVNYSNVCDMIIMSCRISNESKRLKDIVKDLGTYMNKNLDTVRIKGMLESRGCIIVRHELVGGILKVEDWVMVEKKPSSPSSDALAGNLVS